MGKKRNKKRLQALGEQKLVDTNATAEDHNFYDKSQIRQRVEYLQEREELLQEQEELFQAKWEEARCKIEVLKGILHIKQAELEEKRLPLHKEIRQLFEASGIRHAFCKYEVLHYEYVQDLTYENLQVQVLESTHYQDRMETCSVSKSIVLNDQVSNEFNIEE